MRIENAFGQWSLPEAVLKFRQGFGRLIRSKTDRGAILILDRRVLTRRYGRAFIASLPEGVAVHDGRFREVMARLKAVIEG